MMRRPATAALAIALLALIGCGAKDGLPGRINIRDVATIGSDGAEGALSSMPESIIRDSAGHFLVATPSQAAAELVGIYDSTGAFVGRIGRLGDGPGEYRRPGLLLHGPHDSVLIVDNDQRRMTVLSPALSYVRSERLATRAQDVARGSGGQLFINAPSYRRDSIVRPVFLFGAAGELVRAYGTAIAGCRSDCSWRLARSIVPDRQGVWLVTHFFNYSAEHWSADGRMLKRLTFQTDWFSPYDSLLMPTPDRPPQAAVTGAWLDEAGRLWVLGIASDPDWAEGLGAQRTGEGGRQYFPIEREDQALDGIIEVRDTATGALLASHRLDDAPYLLPAGPQLIGRLYEDDAGWVMVELLKLSYESASAH
jgi:hypothetical protein